MTYTKKTLSEIKLIHGNYGNFIKGQKLDKKKEKKYKTPPYQDLAASNEIDGEPLDEKCWPGYEKKGMKTMFGKRYPNCVKKKKTRKEEYSDWRSELNEKKESGEDKFKKNTIKGTKGPTSKSEVKLPKTKNNVKSLNMVNIKPGEPITAKAKGMINRVLGGIDTSREDKLGKKLVDQAKKSKNSASYRAYKDVVKGTAPRRGLAKFVAKGLKTISKTPKGALVAGGLIGAVAGARAIGRKFNEISKKRRDDAIDKQVDKYVADRKIPGGPKKVNYKPTNQYTVTRDSKGKVTGTGKLIRVVPGTEFKEEIMTPAQKRKDTMLKKKYDDSDMKKNMIAQYGKEEGTKIYFAKIRKEAMKEDVLDERLRPLIKGASYLMRKAMKARAKTPMGGVLAALKPTPKKSQLSQFAMYHGTSSKSAGKIMKSGKFKKSIGDVMNPDGSIYTGKRAFATTDPKRAKEYADMTAKYRGGKPEVLAVKVRDSNIMNPSGIPDEYYVKTKHMKPVGRGVKPIKIKKGQVMQNSFNPLEEKLNSEDKPFVKKLVGKLRKGSKTHAKQADDLEKAMNEDMSDKDFKKFNKDMHDAAKAGVSASQETQNKYALELARRRKINKDGTTSTLTNKELKNEETAIESELVIQDWNSDDIKFTEIETVDIIKPKPLKESMSNWREELGEDWQKVNRKDKTDGLSRKAVKAYRRENPGSKLQTAVTKDPKKLKKGSKSAKRRLSFCRRMKGMKKKLTSAKTRRDPDSRINKALRRWNC